MDHPIIVTILYHYPIVQLPIGSMYGIYANIGGMLMVNVAIPYMDPMGNNG